MMRVDHLRFPRSALFICPNWLLASQRKSWEMSVLAAEATDDKMIAPQLSADALALLAQRETARFRRDWDVADRYHEQIGQLEWQVRDMPDGPELVFIKE